MSMFRLNAIAGTDWAEVVTESFYERCPKTTALLVPLMPSQDDITVEFKRELGMHIGAVELVPVKKTKCSLTLDIDPERMFTRKRAYAKIYLEHEYLHACGVDMVRAAFFDGARKIAGVVANVARQERLKWSTPLGASATYATALATPPEPTIIRFHAALPTVIKSWGEDAPRVYRDVMSDSTIVLMGGYFFVTPPGEEVVEEDPCA